MANAKIINYGQPIGAGTTAIPDGLEDALDIESTESKDFLQISTATGDEDVRMVKSAHYAYGDNLNNTPKMTITPQSGQILFDTPAGSNTDFSFRPEGTEVMRINTDGVGVAIAGPTNIKIADTNVTPDTSCDDFIIEGTGSTGMSIVTPNNVSGCYAFRSEASGGGDPSDKHIAIVQGKRDASNNNTVLHRLLDHPADANSYFAFETGGVQRLKLDATGKITIGGSVVTKGKASFVLTGSIDVTGTNTDVPGTGTKYLSELSIGDDILVTGETRTIATITNDTTATVTAAWGSDLANDTSPECNPAAFTVVRDTGALGMVVADDGSVGIGEAANALAPTSRFSVSAGNSNVAFFERAGNSGYFKVESSSDTATIVAGEVLVIKTNGGTEAIRVDTSQNVGIAMTPGGSHKLDVTGTAGLSTGTAWTNTSDSRIKTNVQNIENALDKINGLRPVSFNYTEDYLSVHAEVDGSKRYNSFIAQEYGEVFPDAVSNQGSLERVITPATDDAPAVKETLLENVQQFTPHDLHMYLVGAVQELASQNEALAARIATLEAGD